MTNKTEQLGVWRVDFSPVFIVGDQHMRSGRYWVVPRHWPSYRFDVTIDEFSDFWRVARFECFVDRVWDVVDQLEAEQEGIKMEEKKMEVWKDRFSKGYVLVPAGSDKDVLEGFRVRNFAAFNYRPMQMSTSDDYRKNGEMVCMVDCAIEEKNNRLLSVSLPDWATRPDLKDRFAAAQAQAEHRKNNRTSRDKEEIAEEKDKSKFRPGFKLEKGVKGLGVFSGWGDEYIVGDSGRSTGTYWIVPKYYPSYLFEVTIDEFSDFWRNTNLVGLTESVWDLVKQLEAEQEGIKVEGKTMEVWKNRFSSSYVLVPAGAGEDALEVFRVHKFNAVDYYPMEISTGDDYWKKAEMLCVVDCTLDKNNRIVSVSLPDWAAKPSMKDRFAAAQAEAKHRTGEHSKLPQQKRNKERGDMQCLT